MENLQNIRPDFLGFALPLYEQLGSSHNQNTPDFLGASGVQYHNATTTDALTLLSQAIDADGVKLNIDLTAKTYLYLVLTGIAIFAAGAVVWHFVGKSI